MLGTQQRNCEQFLVVDAMEKINTLKIVCVYSCVYVYVCVYMLTSVIYC